MNSTNSFNICTRCGNSNSLSAKYCSRCGAPLKAPEEPIVCPKCQTRNTSTANFCRSCGTNLHVTTATKTCPSCGREVNATDNVCACGYSFVTAEQTSKGSKKNKSASISTNKSRKVYAHKGARLFASISLALLLIFAYYTLVPYEVFGEQGLVAILRPTFLVEADKGFVQYSPSFFNSDATFYYYGYDFVAPLVAYWWLKPLISVDFVTAMGGMCNIMIAVVALIFAVTLIAQFVECIVRLSINKRAKHFNWYSLAMAIVSSLVFALIAVFNNVTLSSDFATKVASVFTLDSDCSLGYALWAIPVYYWLTFVYSIFAKAKVLKETA